MELYNAMIRGVEGLAGSSTPRARRNPRPGR